jgi:hypothetical protein
VLVVLAGESANDLDHTGDDAEPLAAERFAGSLG